MPGFVMPAPQCGGQGGGGLAVVIERNLRLGAEGCGGRNGGADGEPETVKVVEPEWQVVAVGLGNLFQALDQSLPESAVFCLGGFVVLRRAFGMGPGKQAFRRQGHERIAPGEFAFADARLADLLEQRELPGAIVVVALFAGVVLAVELLALETGGNPIGSGDDPLQESGRPVVGAGGVDGGVGIVVSVAGGERRRIPAQVREMPGGFEGVPGQPGIGCVDMAVVAANGVPRAIQGFVGVQPAIRIQAGAFCELSEVVKECCKREARGWVEHRHGVFEFWFAAQHKDSDSAWQRRQACRRAGGLRMRSPGQRYQARNRLGALLWNRGGRQECSLAHPQNPASSP
jgi:hypothetical protein